MNVFALLAGVALAFSGAFADPVDLPIRIPHIKGLHVDGDAADWGGAGYRIDIVTAADGQTQPSADFAPSVRLAWGAEGIYALVSVVDDTVFESAGEKKLWDGDCVEFFAASAPGSEDYYHVALGTGAAAEYPLIRVNYTDHRSDKSLGALSHQAASKKTDRGYQLEVLLPWSNLGMTPANNGAAALQVYINDADDKTGKFQACWYHQKGQQNQAERMYPVRLARRPSPPERVCVLSSYDGKGHVSIAAKAVPELAGKTLSVIEGRGVLREIPLQPADGWAEGQSLLSMTKLEYAETPAPLVLRIDRDAFATLALEDRSAARAQLLITVDIACSASIFSGDKFPSFDLKQRDLFEELFGTYIVSTAFYDSAYNLQTSPAAPGRYGAVIDIRFQDGHVLRRFQTVFRAPAARDAFFWLTYRSELVLPLPDSWGIEPAAAASQAIALGRYYRHLGLSTLGEDWRTAAVAAGLSETRADAAKSTAADDAWAADRQWWVGLKRKLYGTDKEFSAPFVCPRPKEGTPAPVLRDGSPEQAGIKPEGLPVIDQVCREWTAQSAEPMSVCLARHGVVFFHSAYGERNGQPQTLDTKTWMASISKMMSGILMMTVVDQELVDLDASVDAYLPRFRSAKEGRRKLIVRDCYTHTNGLALDIKHPLRPINHWGDEMHDLEEQIAEYYPFLEPGRYHAYNGVGYAIGGKVMESVTGEALPQLFKRHLLEPLGCERTDAIDGSALSASTAGDMARIAQMVLNKGAYGDLRFFSESTYEKLLPINLGKLLGHPTEQKWGIGVVYQAPAGFGQGSFGHGAASGAILLIDPENDLVVTMTRDRPGPGYADHNPKFFAAIADSLVR